MLKNLMKHLKFDDLLHENLSFTRKQQKLINKCMPAVTYRDINVKESDRLLTFIISLDISLIVLATSPIFTSFCMACMTSVLFWRDPETRTVAEKSC